ncbi:hypothetical protein DL770_009607 [Monosporascus sp. CRB-9-2]|nr:hypothetical protein DL770_009607 [Monosporascus sp. CRB-9-2]
MSAIEESRTFAVSVNAILNVWRNRLLFPEQPSSDRAEELGGTPFIEEAGTKTAFLGKLTGADYGKLGFRTQWKTVPWTNGNVPTVDDRPRTQENVQHSPGPFPVGMEWAVPPCRVRASRGADEQVCAGTVPHTLDATPDPHADIEAVEALDEADDADSPSSGG